MKAAKARRLKAAGWTVGSSKDFLRLNDQEAALVEVKPCSWTPCGRRGETAAFHKSISRETAGVKPVALAKSKQVIRPCHLT